MARREKGTGGIYEYPKSSGRNARFRVTVLIDGKPRHKFFKTEREAKAFLRDETSRQSLAPVDNTTFATFANVYLDNKRLKLKIGSYETLEGTFKILVKYLGHYRLRDIDNEVLQRLINDLAMKKYSQSVMSKVKVNAIAVLRMAAARKVIDQMPVFDITIPNLKNQEENSSPKTNYLNKEELAAYEVECVRTEPYKTKGWKGGTAERRIYVSGWQIMFLIHTGIRIGEALALEWTDYEEDSKTVTINKNVRKTKQGKITQTPKTEAGERVIILNKKAYTDIQQLRAIFDEQTEDIERRRKEKLKKAETEEEKEEINREYAEYKEKHKYICGSSTFPYGQGDSTSVRKIHDRICDAIKLSRPVTLYGATRHTFVTHYYLNHCTDNDFDLAMFSRDIGHSDIRTTMTIYAHLDMVDNRRTKRTVAELKDF